MTTHGAGPTTVWDTVLGTADRMPAATAIRLEHQRISYRELTSRVTRTATALAGACPPGSLVALDATGHAAAAVALLAAARAGCAVLPLSAVDPPRRRAAILRHAAPALLLREEVARPGDTQLCDVPGRTVPRAPTLHDIAYVMYTSGSTGIPKGVLVPHRALASRLRAFAARPGLGPRESMLALTALSFDIVLAEMLLPLTVGGCVAVAPTQARIDPAAFAEAIAEHKPDVVQATPSFWRLVLAGDWEGLPHGRIWCGGEALTPSLARALAPRCAQLWNMYGPTEAAIWASADLIGATGRVSMGHPIPDSGLFLDPPGHGEIILYGPGLAAGYLDAPDATGRHFVKLRTPEGPRACYRTGDRARRLPGGALEYLGRTDAQVKLRGHRVELGAIEAALEEHPLVQQAAVVVQAVDQPERTHIAAHVVLATPDVPQRELRSWLSEQLPAVALPARIVTRTELPRTAAGKIDRVLLATEAAADRR